MKYIRPATRPSRLKTLDDAFRMVQTACASFGVAMFSDWMGNRPMAITALLMAGVLTFRSQTLRNRAVS